MFLHLAIENSVKFTATSQQNKHAQKINLNNCVLFHQCTVYIDACTCTMMTGKYLLQKHSTNYLSVIRIVEYVKRG